MEIIIQKTADDVLKLAAKLITKRVAAKPDAILGLATGRTMEKLYLHLRNAPVSFSQIHSFNLDEYIGLEREDPRSYWSYMHQHFFDHVEIDDARIHLPQTDTDDLALAGASYEAKIKALGGIDLQMLGIGNTGHIGFNEPLSPFSSRTREVVLTPATRAQNAEMFGNDPNNVPERAMTMGVATILEAKELVLLATGKKKATILSKAIEGPLSAQVPATAVQMHANCKIIIDEEAASELSGISDFKYLLERSDFGREFQL